MGSCSALYGFLIDYQRQAGLLVIPLFLLSYTSSFQSQRYHFAAEFYKHIPSQHSFRFPVDILSFLALSRQPIVSQVSRWKRKIRIFICPLVLRPIYNTLLLGPTRHDSRIPTLTVADQRYNHLATNIRIQLHPIERYVPPHTANQISRKRLSEVRI